MENFDFTKIKYKYRPLTKPKTVRNIQAIGFDSEADREGNTFMYCLSDGSIYTPDSLLAGLFNRKHRGKQYVVYNLKYEQGAILQGLPIQALDELRVKGKCTYNEYRYNVVGYKRLSISRGKNSVVFWDMFPFYESSLAAAAEHYTNLKKIDLDTTQFTHDYIDKNWDKIAWYCIHDATITARLFERVKEICARLSVNPTTFYSIATVSHKYVREHCNYVTVQDLWNNDRDVLEMACEAYSGGKFEVTVRGKGHFYEYDINSAYPYEIANLIDITDCRIKHTREYQKKATYGFIKCQVFIDNDMAHTLAVKRKTVNIYPVGRFRRTMTKQEYDYMLTRPEVKMKILKAVWLFPKGKRHPFRKVINNLYKVKADAKQRGDKELYRFSWRFLNSIYGKFVQLVPKPDYIEATTCWNPIYGAIITANTRLRVTEVQNEYSEVVAIHTDSVVSIKPLPLSITLEIGGWSLTVHGIGVIIGCGFYQIGGKVRVRGFPFQDSLFEMLARSPPTITISDQRAVTWRQVVANHWKSHRINLFEHIDKVLNINFDTKRSWSGQWQDGDDALNTILTSFPKIVF